MKVEHMKVEHMKEGRAYEGRKRNMGIIGPTNGGRSSHWGF